MKALRLVVAILAAVCLASAAPVCNEAYPAGTDVETITTCTVGPLVFSNFELTGGLNTGGAGMIGLTTTSFLGNVVDLGFTTDFNLINPGLNRDWIFKYQVDGTVVAIDGAMGGSGNRSMDETACSVPFPAGVSLSCDPGNIVAHLFLTVGNPSGIADGSFLADPLYIGKDISVGAGAGLSDFSQSFEVPEPVTLSLIGFGLFALGLLRRRLKK
jgi:hypothetical protein